MVAPKLYEKNTQIERWIIVDGAGSNSRGKLWLCKCVCGTERIVEGARLRSGRSKSCGCLNVEQTIKSHWRGCGELGMDHWTSIVDSATRRHIEVTITIEDAWNLFLKQNRKCSLTGCDLSMYIHDSYYTYTPKDASRSKGRRSKGTASLDRIDSAKGYTLGNVQWVHKDINKMKLDHSQEQFVKLCRLVVSHAEMQDNVQTETRGANNEIDHGNQETH